MEQSFDFNGKTTPTIPSPISKTQNSIKYSIDFGTASQDKPSDHKPNVQSKPVEEEPIPLSPEIFQDDVDSSKINLKMASFGSQSQFPMDIDDDFTDPLLHKEPPKPKLQYDKLNASCTLGNTLSLAPDLHIQPSEKVSSKYFENQDEAEPIIVSSDVPLRVIPTNEDFPKSSDQTEVMQLSPIKRLESTSVVDKKKVVIIESTPEELNSQYREKHGINKRLSSFPSYTESAEYPTSSIPTNPILKAPIEVEEPVKKFEKKKKEVQQQKKKQEEEDDFVFDDLNTSIIVTNTTSDSKTNETEEEEEEPQTPKPNSKKSNPKAKPKSASPSSTSSRKRGRTDNTESKPISWSKQFKNIILKTKQAVEGDEAAEEEVNSFLNTRGNHTRKKQNKKKKSKSSDSEADEQQREKKRLILKKNATTLFQSKDQYLQIFKGIHFIVTGFNGDEKLKLNNMIANSGGTIVENILKYNIEDTDRVICVKNEQDASSGRTVKYLLALGLECAIVKSDYIRKCVEAGECVFPLEPADMIPCGKVLDEVSQSLQENILVEQNPYAFEDFSVTPRVDRLYAGFKFIVKGDEKFEQTWTHLIHSSGGDVISRHTPSTKVNYILAQDVKCVKELTKAGYRYEDDRFVAPEFIIQTLIASDLIPPTLHRSLYYTPKSSKTQIGACSAVDSATDESSTSSQDHEEEEEEEKPKVKKQKREDIKKSEMKQEKKKQETFSTPSKQTTTPSTTSPRQITTPTKSKITFFGASAPSPFKKVYENIIIDNANYSINNIVRIEEGNKSCIGMITGISKVMDLPEKIEYLLFAPRNSIQSNANKNELVWTGEKLLAPVEAIQSKCTLFKSKEDYETLKNTKSKNNIYYCCVDADQHPLQSKPWSVDFN